MDYIKFNNLINDLKQLRLSTNRLIGAYIREANETTDSNDSIVYMNARLKAGNLKEDIDKIIENSDAFFDLFDLYDHMKLNEDKLYIQRKILKRGESLMNYINKNIDYIKQANLIDFRLYDIGKKCTLTYEEYKDFLYTL